MSMTKTATFILLFVFCPQSRAFQTLPGVGLSTARQNQQQHPSSSLSTRTRTTSVQVGSSGLLETSPETGKSSANDKEATTAPLSLSTSQLQVVKETEEAIIYRKGLITIASITFLFASNSPALHMMFTTSSSASLQPPVILLNAVCSVVAMVCMLAVGPFLNDKVDKPRFLKDQEPEESSTTNPLITSLFGQDQQDLTRVQAGAELGLWKFLGTLVNMYGLSLTTAGHGAFLIQLTTLFVPAAQGFLGVPIPKRIWTAIGLALLGVAVFTQDTTGVGNDGGAVSAMMLQGDLACVVAAVFYATYDLRLFHWGKRVDPLQLITTKIVTQTTLSLILLLTLAWEPSVEYLQAAAVGQQDSSGSSLLLFGAVALWSGVMVNAVAPFLQVGGQQIVGPARAQILYASQPLWAAAMSWALLGETVGPLGAVGGTAFLSAIFLAATADSPDPDCGEDLCET